MTRTREPDVLVLGGGPAGTTVASLLKKYSPHTNVLVCEKARYPRHHIGESLIADINRLLAEMGVYDKVKRAGFIPKAGSTFIWGRDREPWSIEFSRMTEIPGFAPGADYDSSQTWHVRRHEYDQLLLEHAREMGAEVLEETSGEVQFDGETATHVKLSNGEEVRPRFIVDATGQHSHIVRRFGTRVYDPELRNIAIYGYYEGAELDPKLSGTWENSRIAVVSVGEGWLWYIPLAKGLVSVGVVTSKDALAKRNADSPKAFLEENINACDELRPMLANAKRVLFGGAESDVLVLRDYCYSTTKLHGPGWALVGDAAGFVDPILSVGCYLAHSGGQWLATTLNTLLNDPTADERLCWSAYEEQLQFSLRAFRRMTYMWYGFNEAKESWWWEAKHILRSRALPESVDPKTAFLAIATGYGINRPVYQEAISDFGVNIFDSFYKHFVGDESIRTQGIGKGSGARFSLAKPYKSEPWMVPVQGTGRMRPVQRVSFEGDDARGVVPSRLLLPEAHFRLLEKLPGRTPGDALAQLSEEDKQTLAPTVDRFLTGLVHMGVMAATR